MKLTFVICAYKESPYLEECIQSLKGQDTPCEILLATATPGEYLQKLCYKYKIPYYVREGKPAIAADWNYAFSLAKTPYVTIAHQDDIYEHSYATQVIAKMESAEEPLIGFTDYTELRDGKKIEKNTNLAIKRALLRPLRHPGRTASRFWRRFAIRFGNAICCPSVTYNKPEIEELVRVQKRESLFLTHFRSNLDWETWEWLSHFNGQFLYLPQCLMSHRIHAGSETTATIQEKKRGQEDYEMFCRFWPKGIAKIITGYYGKSEESNRVQK